MSSQSLPSFEEFTPQERRDITEVPGDFWRQGPEDTNYRVDYRNKKTYLFKVDKSPLGVKFYYKGSLTNSKETVPIPGTLYEEIRQKPTLGVGNLDGVTVRGRTP